MRLSCAARVRTVSPTSGWAPSLASTRTSCQFGAVWACTLSKNCCKNCGGVLYSGVRMLMVGQPSARAAASERWVSSVCFDGRYRAFFAEEPPLKKADGSPGHDADALFFCQRPRIAEQFFDAFRFKAHGMAPHKSSLCAKGGGWYRCIAKFASTLAPCAQYGHGRIFAR